MASDVEVFKKVLQDDSFGFFVLDDDEEKAVSIPAFCSFQWVNRDKNLIEISKKYPDVLFMLHTQEEDVEPTLHYYKNGKIQNAKVYVSYEQFDENKLKELE